MGLLTSDGNNKTNILYKLVTNHWSKLSILSYLSGLVVSAILLSQSDRTYFSDNALLPGLVQREFTYKEMTDETLKQLEQVAQQLPQDVVPYNWLIKQFQQIGLEVYSHNFTLNYPFGDKTRFEGKNIYAILRSERTASTEAIVLSSPYRTKLSQHSSTLPGIALMISLAKYFSRENYWAKDLIFLINEYELVGIQSWLNAYHNIDVTPVLNHGMLDSRSGAIQAAINLEIHSHIFSNLDIKIEGLNGQLPNLDLFNVAVELCTRESVSPTFHGKSQPIENDEFELWKEYATTTASMMISQAIGLPTGAHGLFQRFSIQAITLEGYEATKSSYLKVSLLQMGRVIEGIFRSLNNLLERFNRSYYFYLLTSTRRYISIGYYMIPFACIAVPLVLNALYLYLKSEEEITEKSGNLWNCIPFTFVCHALGILTLLVPIFVEKYSQLVTNYETRDVIYYTLLSVCLMYIMNPILRCNHLNRNSRKCLSLLNIALLLCCISLVNISLAFFLTLIYVPIACLTAISLRLWYRIMNSILLLLVHPLSIFYLCLLLMSIYYNPEFTLTKHLVIAFEAQKKCLLFYIEDWYIYGQWIFPIGCTALLPVWLQLWYTL
ncbi:glycosylphosphatidylinositol anchor attachment 1 protein-like [Oppia nitens]|uniref:glycosylphosphatidylinositol anchor attachment 1 protein-like n=1 Tax=Oppia nitens TaxID=1686743 RepID=UPI0023DA36DA|nr:glycosylphosphatidylinositol anchor attachment 1 protein-like [Oppia nitens]